MRVDEAENVATLVRALGGRSIGNALDTFVQRIAPFDMSSIFAFHPGARPVVVHDGYSGEVRRDALAAYVQGGYLLDPFYVACVEGIEDGRWRMAQLAPDDYFTTNVPALGLVHPCISEEAGALVEEIGYIVGGLPGGWSLTYSLMRHRGSTPFDPAQFEALAAVAPLVGAVLTVHRSWATPPVEPSISPEAEVETVLRSAFADQLTPAQFRVVTLILRGHSNASIARELHITQGTAKLHRHNAYQRLGISGQAELFGLFLSGLAPH